MRIVVRQETVCFTVFLRDEGIFHLDLGRDENVVYLRMNDRCNVIFWYQTADAYPLPEGFKKSDIYNKIREANGDPNHDKYPPNLVGLPEYITLTDRNGNEVKVKRKDEFEIMRAAPLVV